MQPPRPEQRQRAKPAARRDSILGLARGAGTVGISTAQICTELNLGNRLVSVLVSQYKAAGYLHAAGGPMQRRYFTDPTLAAEMDRQLQATALGRAAAAAELARAKQRQREQRRDAARRETKQREAELLGQIAMLEQQLAQRRRPAEPVLVPVPEPAAAAPSVQASPVVPPKKPRIRPPKALAQPLKGALRANDTRPGRHQVVSLPTPVPAPVAIAEEQRRPSGEVIVPANVKRTVKPAPAGRYEVTGPVIGGFATMRPGHYLPKAGFSSYLDANR